MTFFFSSRRRHTRFDCDWSSDVCSSDLMALGELERSAPSWSGHASILWTLATKGLSARSVVAVRQGEAGFDSLFEASGSEERREGKSGDLRGRPVIKKKKRNNSGVAGR